MAQRRSRADTMQGRGTLRPARDSERLRTDPRDRPFPWEPLFDTSVFDPSWETGVKGVVRRTLPQLSEEEQAYANARAEREQAALRVRRTAARPGISDAAWRTAYNVGDVVDRAAGTLGGFVKGAVIGSNESLVDPWSDIDPNMRFSDLSSEQVGDLFGLAVMPLLSPLRNPVYQAQMLRKLRKQISRLDQRYRPALERLMETHPRLLAAFQHAGGTLEGNVGPRLGPSGSAEGLYSNLLTRQATGVTAHAPLSPDFTSFKGTPGIQFKGGPYLAYDPATVVPHEFAHFAQDLGGHGVLRQKIDVDARILADKAEGLSDRWKQFRAGGGKIGLRPGELDQGTFPMSPEQYRRHNEFMDEGRRIRSLPGEHELGAERAAIRQRERFERWKRGESDWDQYKGPGHGQEARHLTLDEAEPGKLTRKLVVAGRWTEEKRKLMEARSDRQRRRWDQARRKALAESAQKRREGLLRFWPF